jgi:uridine kinase
MKPEPAQRSQRKKPPVFVAIVGGSGAGKTWLTQKLQRLLAGKATRVSLDDFYRDRSHIPAIRRARINFDNPRAIDWESLEKTLSHLRSNQPAPLPCYSFKTHCRLRTEKVLQPKSIILVDGLWLLRRPALRRSFTLRVFIDCPTQVRLQRRLTRDLVSRGRTRTSVQKQFRETVQPMHARFVAPQKRWADVILPADFDEGDMRELAERLKRLIRQPR